MNSRNSLRSGGGKVVEVGVETFVADEMAAVEVGAEFLDQALPFSAHAADVDAVHGGEIGGVEAGAQHRVLLGVAGAFVGLPSRGRFFRR